MSAITRREPDKAPGARRRMAREIQNHIDKTGVVEAGLILLWTRTKQHDHESNSEFLRAL